MCANETRHHEDTIHNNPHSRHRWSLQSRKDLDLQSRKVYLPGFLPIWPMIVHGTIIQLVSAMNVMSVLYLLEDQPEDSLA